MSTNPAEATPEEGVVTLSKADFEDLKKSLESAESTIAELKATDPATRPAIGDATDIKAGETASEDHPVFQKGYLPPTVKRDSEAYKGINVNLFPKGDIDNFSMARLLLAQGKSQQLGEAAYKKFSPWEWGYIQAMEKANLGDQVSGQDGGFLAPEIWSTDFYDRLYADAMVGQLPVSRIRMSGRTQHFPVLTNGVTVYYSAENSAITASSATFRQLTLNAKKQSALTYISNELILDANPDAERILRNNLTREMAQDMDKQVFLGNGQSGAPTGLLNATNVSSGGMAGAHLAYTDITKAIYNVMVLNNSANVGVGQATCTGIAANPALLKQVANFVDNSGRAMWDFGIRGMPLPGDKNALSNFLGVPTVAVSAVLPGTEGSQAIFAGDFQYLIVAERSDLELMSSNVAGNTFANDQTAVRAIHRYDVGVAHPEAFYVITSITS